MSSLCSQQQAAAAGRLISDQPSLQEIRQLALKMGKFPGRGYVNFGRKRRLVLYQTASILHAGIVFMMTVNRRQKRLMLAQYDAEVSILYNGSEYKPFMTSFAGIESDTVYFNLQKSLTSV